MSFTAKTCNSYIKMTGQKRYEIKFGETAIEIIERNRLRLGGLSTNKFVNLVVLYFGDHLLTGNGGDRILWLPSDPPINSSLDRTKKSISFSPSVLEVVQRNCARLDNLPVNRFVNSVVLFYGDRLRFNSSDGNPMEVMNR